jgi:hypothetical protein
MLQPFRWTIISIVLAIAALTISACGSEDAPADTPGVSPDRPTFIFFFTDP